MKCFDLTWLCTINVFEKKRKMWTMLGSKKLVQCYMDDQDIKRVFWASVRSCLLSSFVLFNPHSIGQKGSWNWVYFRLEAYISAQKIGILPAAIVHNLLTWSATLVTSLQTVISPSSSCSVISLGWALRGAAIPPNLASIESLANSWRRLLKYWLREEKIWSHDTILAWSPTQ